MSACAGVQEELFCAVDTDNIDICPGLVKSAARHVETYVQVKEPSTRRCLDRTCAWAQGECASLCMAALSGSYNKH